MKSIYKFYILTFLFLSDFVLFAQPGDDDGGGGLEGDDPPAAPIDGKLIWLAIVSVFFAYYILNKRTQKVK
jgi:hypothetical protein